MTVLKKSEKNYWQTWQMSELHLQIVTPHAPEAVVEEDWK
jgi:predicted alpha/beta hydrolase family esterase